MKKKKDNVKYNTVPNGRIIVSVFWTITIVFIFMCLLFWLFHDSTGFLMLPFAIIMLTFAIVFHWKKYSNVIKFTNEKITLKRKSISWNDVYITLYCPGPTFLRKNYDVYIYFDDHYLTEKEVHSFAIKKKGFFIILNGERTQYILSHYPKSVRVLNNYALVDRDGVMSMIMSHNVTFS